MANSGSFYRVLSAEDYEERLFDFLGKERRDSLRPVDLARFRRRQLLRIVLRDVLGVATLSDITEELSNLADAILDLTYRRIRARLVARHGEPRLADGRYLRVFGDLTGQAGGQGAELQLRYRPDVRLRRQRRNRWPDRISNKEFFKKVANEYTALLSTYTAEGHCYRVDLRLRPDGTLGEICISADGARNYYIGPRARLGKADADQGAGFGRRDRTRRGAAGVRGAADLSELARFSRRGSGIGNPPANQRKASVETARATAAWILSWRRGGIRDIEFLVQCLQRLHGGREPWVRHGGTMFALFRLRDKGLLSDVRICAARECLPISALPGAPAAA